MTEELKQFEKTIKKKHSFSWTPSFEDEIKTDLKKTVVIPIVLKTFEKLGWDVVFQDETSAEAKRKGDWDRWTEKISVSFQQGKLKVKSVSLGNEMWDVGRNSKRVQLFIYAFQQTEKEFDHEAIATLEKEVEETNNWDHYEIPASLPQPKIRKEPQFWIPVVGGIMTALLIGFVIAFLSVNGVYIIGLFEVGVAIIISFVLSQLIQLSNYTNYNKLHYVLIGIIILTYVSNQYFQYQLILVENSLYDFSFWEFMSVRIEAGLTIKDMDTGWIGLLISWVLQLVITYFFTAFRLVSSLTAYQLKRIPPEVIDFTYYHFVKGKTETQVRSELFSMGWKDKQDQDEIFESFGAIMNANELRRMD